MTAVPNVYDEFRDNSGNQVRVFEGAGMYADFVLIATTTPRYAYVPAELDLAMATRLRDALTVFIDEHTPGDSKAAS